MMASACQEEMREHARLHEFAAKEGNTDYIHEDFDKFAVEIGEFCRGILRCITK